MMLQSQNSLDLSPSFQYSRAALMRLKESSQSPKKQLEEEIDMPTGSYKKQQNALLSNPEQSLESALGSQEMVGGVGSANCPGTLMQDSNFRLKLHKSKQLLLVNRKLSSVLEASPLKNSYIGRIFHDRYQTHLQQPDGSLTLASILNETLSKLKGRKPNRAFLKPLKNIQNSEFPSTKNVRARVNVTGENLPQEYQMQDRYNNQKLHDSYIKDVPQNTSQLLNHGQGDGGFGGSPQNSASNCKENRGDGTGHQHNSSVNVAAIEGRIKSGGDLNTSALNVLNNENDMSEILMDGSI